jgi:hypothetical protein
MALGQSAQRKSEDTMNWVFDDGGRAAAGYKGHAGDCVTRSVSIALELPYKEVYEAMAKRMQTHPGARGGKRSARNGVSRCVYDDFLKSRGWIWTATMRIGSGCKVHLLENELPSGRLIVRVSKHLTTVIDGVIHDTFDPQRGATHWYNKDGQIDRVSPERCVYGYYQAPNSTQEIA